jgi:hypothetical protein
MCEESERLVSVYNFLYYILQGSVAPLPDEVWYHGYHATWTQRVGIGEPS